MVVGMSLYSQIREAYISGESQRSIAKRLGVSRPTVKKYCEGAIMPGVRKEYLRTPSVVTPQVENFIRMCLETDKEEGLRKQSHTAKRIYDRLVSEILVHRNATVRGAIQVELQTFVEPVLCGLCYFEVAALQVVVKTLIGDFVPFNSCRLIVGDNIAVRSTNLLQGIAGSDQHIVKYRDTAGIGDSVYTVPAWTAVRFLDWTPMLLSGSTMSHSAETARYSACSPYPDRWQCSQHGSH